MKNSVSKIALALAALAAVLPLAGSCDLMFGKVEGPPADGMGRLSVALAAPTTSSRTMLAANPEFTRYELYVSPDPETGADSKTYSSNAASFQLSLPNGTYVLSGAGFTGNKPTARTWDLVSRDLTTESVTVAGATLVETSLTLSPYMEDDVFGVLRYSLNWDTVGQIPSRAELLIEQYNDNGTPADVDDDLWDPLPISLIGQGLAAGTQRGTVILLQRTTGLVQQSGSLDLPPGEYRLTATVTMDGPYPPVSRSDIAHIFSNLVTPAAFFYGSGDLTVTGAGMDTGSGFIARFNFAQTPGAVSVVGSAPGPDGTRLIMVMVPPDTDLTRLTPVVECVPGARIISPAPSVALDGSFFWPAGDYSKPSSWTAEGRNGVSQPYTVMVTKQTADDCFITGIAFDDVMLTAHPAIDHTLGSILVEAPNGTRAANPNYELEPVISFAGKEIKRVDLDYLTDPSHDSPFIQGDPLVFMEDGAPSQTFRVYAQSGATKLYSVSILEAASGEAEITKFFFDGYPDRPGVITQPSGNPPGGGEIKVALPYGVPIGSFKPLITYKGSLNPASGVEQNFNVPVLYTVRSADGQHTKSYIVTVYTDGPSTDTGIFDMVIVNVPRAKVVVGTKARPDGKIPVVVETPYATSPFITPQPSDGPRTDLKSLIPLITLSSSTSTVSPAADGLAPHYIPFDNQGDYQEAVYRVTAQAGNYQDYVVVAARDVQYYYVKATGDDTDPDQYNGGSESTPFKTLAYAVYQAVKHNVDHIFVIGTLNDASEGGAYEDTSATALGSQGTFQPSGAPPVAGGSSVFTLRGAGRNGAAAQRLYITGVGSNAALQGAAGKRVMSVTGGARVTFDNIAIRGGTSYAGNGGGLYIGENSTVVWKSGGIAGNTAVSGGGVYVDNSEFDFMTGSISSNTATGSRAADASGDNPHPDIDGGGGVYVKGEDSLFWLKNGNISHNATAGSGGGVMVNGSTIPNRPTQDTQPHNFIMSGGAVESNNATGNRWPHGGGGVYVAKGTFEMLNGTITDNTSPRQGGGVFVWSRALFVMSGDSSVIANDGVGSSKAICNRGITRMEGKAQADKVYVWNYLKGRWNNGAGDEFTLTDGARAADVMLAFADSPRDSRNYINIIAQPNGQFFAGTDTVTTVFLESHLTTAGKFDTEATLEGDWVGHHLIKYANGNQIPPAQAAALTKRFLLGNFTYGKTPSISLSGHTLDNTGKLQKN